MTTVLVVDNHDSFVHTLVGYLRELGATTELVEADAVTDPRGAIAGFDGVLVSPGPGTPQDAGASIPIVAAAASVRTPLLGVCLGHQAIAVAFGGRVGEAPELMHGMTSNVLHDSSALYRGMRHPFVAGRYHSLAVEAAHLPDVLAVTARTAEGTVMGIAHRSLPIQGVQFHPESVLTQGGYRLLGNWLASIGLEGADETGAGLQPHRAAAAQH
ncbi:anthranilate synthase component II [Microbacterium imperiale]|uniref:Anthranilate synthase component 2 n=1 Tax=Microbacterium imperiale TaxID=33884 RepID=A0A9W6HGY1_9MICO|nr:gamma-glutamyl-gamma-aminobutyrate hydrolase family protein [Microbacterium imperiale]MBP2421036.1 para-aminobenzoate synthetase component 2 [Microbacterium imperiale]MDS0199849.1 gamma-glutamyl-gamma-aminobutyrate hydrolase family protein [Microbacterium imperiale]BFE41379.1 aminodeoxychorismate/anthranilate synthase component II [Microbacterium imperiale]GLJ80330.1 anthranilate synthase component 2 [Microbacterium imperiale]